MLCGFCPVFKERYLISPDEKMHDREANENSGDSVTIIDKMYDKYMEYNR